MKEGTNNTTEDGTMKNETHRATIQGKHGEGTVAVDIFRMANGTVGGSAITMILEIDKPYQKMYRRTWTTDKWESEHFISEDAIMAKYRKLVAKYITKQEVV
jgi:hypothetical protein